GIPSPSGHSGCPARAIPLPAPAKHPPHSGSCRGFSGWAPPHPATGGAAPAVHRSGARATTLPGRVASWRPLLPVRLHEANQTVYPHETHEREDKDQPTREGGKEPLGVFYPAPLADEPGD